jgi:hypothetical protein
MLLATSRIRVRRIDMSASSKTRPHSKIGKLTHGYPTRHPSLWAMCGREASMCAPCRSINRLTRIREETGEVVLASSRFSRYVYRRSRPADPRLQPKEQPVQSLRPRQIRRVAPDGLMDLVRWRHLLGQAVRRAGLAANDSSDPRRRGRSETDVGRGGRAPTFGRPRIKDFACSRREESRCTTGTGGLAVSRSIDDVDWHSQRRERTTYAPSRRQPGATGPSRPGGVRRPRRRSPSVGGAPLLAPFRPPRS